MIHPRPSSRSQWQFRTSAMTFGRQMFIPCAPEIFYYHGNVQAVSTKRMQAQDAGLIGVPGLEIAETSWKQTTPTLPNSPHGGSPPFAPRAARHSFTLRRAPFDEGPLVYPEERFLRRRATRHCPSLAAVAANRYSSQLEIVITRCKQKRKDFLIGTKNAPSRSPVTPEASGHQSPLT
jgi:hypothetical protein